MPRSEIKIGVRHLSFIGIVADLDGRTMFHSLDAMFFIEWDILIGNRTADTGTVACPFLLYKKFRTNGRCSAKSEQQTFPFRSGNILPLAGSRRRTAGQECRLRSVPSVWLQGRHLLMAEIGDVRRFSSKRSRIAFAGIEPLPNDSGKVVGNDKGISKVGSAVLRRTLFLISREQTGGIRCFFFRKNRK